MCVSKKRQIEYTSSRIALSCACTNLISYQLVIANYTDNEDSE